MKPPKHRYLMHRANHRGRRSPQELWRGPSRSEGGHLLRRAGSPQAAPAGSSVRMLGLQVPWPVAGGAEEVLGEPGSGSAFSAASLHSAPGSPFNSKSPLAPSVQK